MAALAEFYASVARLHLDALLVVAAATTGWLVSRRSVARQGTTHDLSGLLCGLALAAALAGALLASLAEPALARLAILGLAAALSAALLASAQHIAALRTQLRGRDQAERQLLQARASADEANQAKSDFLAVMGHEIRTPLNAVMGFANLLRESRLDDTQRSYVTTILGEGARLGSLMNDILDLTKIERGRLTLEHVPFGPAETAQDVVRLFAPRAAQRQLELRFVPELSDPLIVEGDPMRFRQILVNLVDNALKFTPHGSVTVGMAWTPPVAGATQGCLTVRVTDTGIGIPRNKIGGLFQMFTQGDTSTARRYGGSGLGLAICQRLAHLMEGEITVSSESGIGTEFTVTVLLGAFVLPETPARHTDTARNPRSAPQHA
ncbi:MAG: ATP-binding protein [Opitutaceae bacterium]|nr:ATP-binding protein [Opitutaceae bacterium]